MRTPTDVLLSLVRYTALALGDEWEVTFDDSLFKRPWAVVSRVDRVVTSGGTQQWAESVAPFHIAAYPKTEGLLAEEAFFAGLRVEEQLDAAFERGIDLGRPRRVPLYEYEGAGPFSSSTTRGSADFLRVIDFSTNVLRDPNQRDLVYVTADVRVAWRRGRAVPSSERTVNRINVEESVG